MTMNMKQAAANAERVVRVQNGWVMLPVLVALLLADIALLIFSMEEGTRPISQPRAGLVVVFLLLLLVCVILRKGFFTLQPNEARALRQLRGYSALERISLGESVLHQRNSAVRWTHRRCRDAKQTGQRQDQHWGDLTANFGPEQDVA